MPDRRNDTAARTRLKTIEENYVRWSRKTVVILVLLAAFQLGLGVLSVSLLGRQDKAEANSKRIDQAVCAEVHYLERGAELTADAPEQAIVHNELKILLGNLRPLVPTCPPAEPFKAPEGPLNGSWVKP